MAEQWAASQARVKKQKIRHRVRDALNKTRHALWAEPQLVRGALLFSIPSSCTVLHPPFLGFQVFLLFCPTVRRKTRPLSLSLFLLGSDTPRMRSPSPALELHPPNTTTPVRVVGRIWRCMDTQSSVSQKESWWVPPDCICSMFSVSDFVSGRQKGQPGHLKNNCNKHKGRQGLGFEMLIWRQKAVKCHIASKLGESWIFFFCFPHICTQTLAVKSAHLKNFALALIRVSLRMVVLELLCGGLTPQKTLKNHLRTRSSSTSLTGAGWSALCIVSAFNSLLVPM